MNMEKKELWAGVAAFLAAVFVFYLIGASTILRDHRTDTYYLKARFNQADGLIVGGQVRLAGIKIGEVISETLDDHYGVVVTFSLPERIQLPDDTGASVQSTSLIGSKYIELLPGGSEDMLEPGDSIQFTEDSPNLEKLLDKVIAMAKADRKKNKCP